MRTIANMMFRIRGQHVEGKTELHQCDLMLINRVRTHRECRLIALNNREDVDAFATEGFFDAVAAPLAEAEHKVRHTASSGVCIITHLD